jgi:hypothetical protein
VIDELTRDWLADWRGSGNEQGWAKTPNNHIQHRCGWGGERHGNALLVQLKAGCLRTRGACRKVGTSVR